MQKDISIIIPAYNEENRITDTLGKLVSFQQKHDIRLEIIVVCDGCIDSTESIALSFSDRLCMKIISYEDNAGKGYAVKKGVEVAVGRIIGYMDADGSTSLSAILPFYNIITNDKAEIVIGSRRGSLSRLVKKQSPVRHILGTIFSLITLKISGLPFTDTQCGFKFFKNESAKHLFARLESDGFGFDIELLTKALMLKYRVIEEPVEWTNVPNSKVRLFHDSIDMLLTVNKYRSKDYVLPNQEKSNKQGLSTQCVR